MTMSSPVTNEAPRADDAVVSVKNLRKTFRRADGSKVPAIDGISLDIAQGEFLVLLGPSGCGKTTLLRSIAGLEQPDGGEISIRDKTVYSSERRVDLPPERRGLSMIFQSYALWPHLNVYQNVIYPLQNARRPRLPKKEMSKRVHDVLEMLGIGALAKQHPSAMSGGQQQRVALARALVSQQDVVLFDEPLSNVDAKVREQLRLELLSMQAKIGFSAIYVTHDQIEAMELADRVAVLRDGHVEQLGSPDEIYDRPTSRYVAKFIGAMNEITGTVDRVFDSGELRVQTAIGQMVCRAPDQAFAAGDDVVLLGRPERFHLTSVGEPTVHENEFTVEGVTSMYLGAHSEHVVQAGEQTIRVWSAEQASISRGAQYRLSIAADDVRVLPA